MSSLPILALSMGDPAGIGPELCLRAANDAGLRQQAQIRLYGDPALFERVASQLRLSLAAPIVRVLSEGFAAHEVVPGQSDAACGRVSAACVLAACDAVRADQAQALVTAPIRKSSWQSAGIDAPGHTELLARRCGLADDDVSMLLSDGAGLHVVLVTCHCPLAAVPGRITAAAVTAASCRLDAALRRFLGRSPRIAILGLNPHAGEGGLLGDEETNHIAPAVAQLRRSGLDVHGPLPADTAFTPAGRQRYDGWVAMYHDQGLAPFKALAFDHGVNVTLGLPIVRTSPDHGTADDLAWTGRADPASFLAACRMAVQLLQ